MKALLAALLLAPLTAAAACFIHPDTGTSHCSSAAECPSGSTGWNPATWACTAPPACAGADSGAYTPGVERMINAYIVAPRRAFWTRVGAVVTVAGAVAFLPNGLGPTWFDLRLPIATTFSAEDDAAGVMATRGEEGVGIIAVPGASTVRFLYLGTGQYVNEAGRYTYTYRIAECP